MMENLGIINFPAFLLAGILLNITPGADTLYILGRSISQGKKAGILSALGISTGAVLHTAAAACGLSAILANSATAFMVVKYLGAVYLIFLGIKSLMASGEIICTDNNSGKNSTNRDIYIAGILTNVLNPKVALFFLAFLPQFIDVNHQGSTVSFLALGVTFISTGTIWCLILAVFAGVLRDKLGGEGSFSKNLHRLCGTLFIGLGLSLAFSNE